MELNSEWCLLVNLNPLNQAYNDALVNYLSKWEVFNHHKPVMTDGVDGFGMYIHESIYQWWATIDKMRNSMEAFQEGWDSRAWSAR